MPNQIVLPSFQKAGRYHFQITPLKQDKYRTSSEFLKRRSWNLPAQFQVIWGQNSPKQSINSIKKI